MCKYSILAKKPNGMIRYCHECETYSLLFNNVLMSFDPNGFEGFKNTIYDCYEHNSEQHFPEHRNVKDITFNTQTKGMSLLFSTNEVATILSMMQDAELAFMEISDWGQEHSF
ncbi:MAG: hypothetical protein ACI9XO_004190 [Paraglaciecola sp.]|jgi:hypothetical protein